MGEVASAFSIYALTLNLLPDSLASQMKHEIKRGKFQRGLVTHCGTLKELKLNAASQSV